MVDPVSVPEAAEALELTPSRVHALVAHGQMPALKIGGRWLIERAAVDRRRRESTQSGRPFAPHNAWALLRLASGEDVDGIDPSVRSRLRRSLAIDGLQKLGSRLARRAEHHRFGAHPGEIPYLLEDPRFVRSGISAAGAYEIDLAAGREGDGYLRAGDLKKFAANHALQATDQSGNVLLRVVPEKAWRFLEGTSVAPLAAVALDLAEDPDPRSSRAGYAALRGLPPIE